MYLKTKTKSFVANLISIKIIGPIVVQRSLSLKKVMRYLIGVNFINILSTPFLYESALHSFSLVISSTLYTRVFRTNVVLADFSSYVYIEKAAETMFVQKIRT
jgi:hypothetical protein